MALLRVLSDALYHKGIFVSADCEVKVSFISSFFFFFFFSLQYTTTGTGLSSYI
jgi:hypothetical protein